MWFHNLGHFPIKDLFFTNMPMKIIYIGYKQIQQNNFEFNILN